MSKIAVVYWSGTGNTETMAECVKKGATEVGATVDMFTAVEFDSKLVTEYDAIAFGCPSMGAEELEDTEFEPMFTACSSELTGKKIALFGSYGWGDGEWMRIWEDNCRELGANLVCDSVICCESPDSEAENACMNLGKSLT